MPGSSPPERRCPPSEPWPRTCGSPWAPRISVITTKRAYDELEADGFLYTVAGKGCFVAEKNLDLIREQKLKELEDHLDAAVELAAQCGISSAQLQEMLRILLREEGTHERD